MIVTIQMELHIDEAQAMISCFRESIQKWDA